MEGKTLEFVQTDDEFINSLRCDYPLNSNEAYEIIKYLVTFSIGCNRFKIAPNHFNRRVTLFVLDLYTMGYSTERVMTLASWADESLRIDGIPRNGQY